MKCQWTCVRSVSNVPGVVPGASEDREGTGRAAMFRSESHTHLFIPRMHMVPQLQPERDRLCHSEACVVILSASLSERPLTVAPRDLAICSAKKSKELFGALFGERGHDASLGHGEHDLTWGFQAGCCRVSHQSVPSPPDMRSDLKPKVGWIVPSRRALRGVRVVMASRPDPPRTFEKTRAPHPHRFRHRLCKSIISSLQRLVDPCQFECEVLRLIWSPRSR